MLHSMKPDSSGRFEPDLTRERSTQLQAREAKRQPGPGLWRAMRRLVVVPAILLLLGTAVAQSADPSSETGSAAASQPSNSSTASQDAGSPDVTAPEGGTPDQVTYGGTIEGRFDSNEPGGSGGQPGFSYRVAPQVTFRRVRPRYNLFASYVPTWTRDRLFGLRNYFDQAASASLQVQPVNHWQLTFRNDYQVSTDTGTSPDHVAQVPIVTPNGGVLFDARRITENGSLEVDGELGPHTTVGLSGSYLSRDFTSVTSTAVPLINSRMVLGRGWFAHQISPRNTVGVMYSAQKLQLQRVTEASTFTHTIFATYQFQVTPRQKLQLFGGPEYSQLHDQLVLDLGLFVLQIPIRTAHWSEAGGASYSWQGERTHASATFLRTISDGGGILGVARVTSVAVEVGRQLDANWDASIGSSYIVSRTLLVSQNGQYRTAVVTVDLSRRLTRDISLETAYQFITQNEGQLVGLPVDHNRVFVRLNFDFKRMLGR